MRKACYLLSPLLAAALLVPAVAKAHDFSAVSPNGDTLYYNINAGTWTATVTYPGTSTGWYGHTKPSGALVIPSTVRYAGNDYTVTAIGANAFGETGYGVCTGITSVVIPSTVKSIGSASFARLPILSATLNEGLEVIGVNAFYLSSLQTLSLPSTLRRIEYGAFRSCSQIAGQVNIPDGVTFIGDDAFASCSAITSMHLPATLDRVPVGLFYHCSRLASAVVPNNVTEIGTSAFYECTALREVHLGSSIVTIGESAFSGCTSLSALSLPDGVTAIGNGAFTGCSSLLTVGFGSSLVSIGANAFDGCSLLTSIALPPTVETIGSGAFMRCSSLATATLGASLTSIGTNAFFECTRLRAIAVPNTCVSIGDQAFMRCTALATVSLGNGLQTLGTEAFSGCTALRSIHLPASVRTIGNYPFAGAPLTSLTVDPANPAFDSRNNCNAIVRTPTNTLQVGCGSTVIPSTVTAIAQYAFRFVPNLTSIVIPNSVVTIGYGAFDNCPNLSDVVVGSGCTSIGGYAFAYCPRLANLIFLGETAPSPGSCIFCSSPAPLVSIPCGNLASYQSGYGGYTLVEREVANPPTGPWAASTSARAPPATTPPPSSSPCPTAATASTTGATAAPRTR